jgi:hypothetical protein
MGDSALFLVIAGLGVAGYGAYKLAVRSRSESAMEQAYRKSWGDTATTPNPYVLRNNRLVGIICIITGIGLAGLALAAGLQE